ncbi:hypothetical protein N7481_008186 [Penicillium waksmanii]|uniref:uncharacterized protein n=1 Tax=Penicillium waksmanii TaxID=69791 RepID=UPI0025471A1C|nr:uncharacterized protein N7481_008186 [Penicillium waksmanii]KAJ5980888.1 hypothetical protein N7481_008186 [Penicillium waksmanii]
MYGTLDEQNHNASDIQAMEKAWDEATETDLLEALEEALGCTKCQITITEAIMKGDINDGVYNSSHYPPFFVNKRTRDDNISPLDTETKHTDPTWWRRISVSQRERYYVLVENNLNRALEETKNADPEAAVLFAHYQVDYHIRQHHLARRGVLNLCRDSNDLHELRSWQWDMAAIDRLISGKEIEVTDEDEGWLPAERMWGWPTDQNLEKTHQVILWKRSWPTRRKKLKAVRAKWAVIIEERRKQREMLLLKQGATVTLRLYCRGELWDVRKLQREVETGTSIRMGRTTQSLGF